MSSDPQLQEAIEELMSNREEYSPLIEAIRQKKPKEEIAAAIAPALGEAIRDARAAIPAVKGVVTSIKDGSSTSEFKLMSKVNQILTILIILAPVMEAILVFMSKSDSFGGSLIVSGLMGGVKALLAMKYEHSRSVLKKTELDPQK